MLKDVFGLITWQSVLLGVSAVLVTFAISLAIVSVIMVKIPADYFHSGPSARVVGRQASGRSPISAIIGKNLLGVLLVALGIVMSLPGVPGQGILTILLGVMLLDFPGKRKLEHKLVSRPQVLKAINKLRHRFGKPSLELD